MRRLAQPGPAPAERIVARGGNGTALGVTLEAGRSLNEALTAPLAGAGFTCGTLVFGGIVLAPFRYYLPGPPKDDTHAAWFAGPHEAAFARVERANATFGWRDGAPYVHCHAVWTEPDGTHRAGHIIPEASEVRDGGEARAWALPGVRIEARADPETNFPLFTPEGSDGDGLIVARIRPNEDLCEAVEALCRMRGIAAATVRGSVGSLVGARFTNGNGVDDPATEVLVTRGVVRPTRSGPIAELGLLVADMAGRPRQGILRRGENAVCITFELFLEPDAPGHGNKVVEYLSRA